MEKIEPGKIYFLGETAFMLRMSEKTLRRKCVRNKIEFMNDGTYKFKGQWIIDYIEKYSRKTLN